MRLMYDALNPEPIPTDAQMVASYIDGGGAPAPGWEARFPHAVIVKIARVATTNDGHVADMESGDMTPQLLLEWVRLRRAHGADPSAYFSQSRLGEVQAVFAAAGEAMPHLWEAAWNGQQTLLPGAVAHQFSADGPYDRSIVADVWPGVDNAPAQPEPAPAPAAAGQYRVVAGDTLTAIAQRYDVTLAQLEQANQGAGHPAGNFDLIRPGDMLTIPGHGYVPPAPLVQSGETYTVVKGDNMSVIAERHSVTLQALEQANQGAGHPPGNYGDIWPGDELHIP